MAKRAVTWNAKVAKHAKNGLLCGLSGLCVLVGAVTAGAAPPVRTMYVDALGREHDVRAVLAAPDVTPAALPEVRAVIAAYESLVKQYPASGYSDNALWQAGTLALDAFATFNQPQDKVTAIRLLRKLAATYVTSKLAKQVPDRLARVATTVDDGLRRPVLDTRERNGASASGEGVGPLALIKDIRRTVLSDAVRVTIELDAEVPFHEERIADPSRVFVDLPGTRAAARLVDHTIRFESDADIVRQIRIGRHPNNTTRVVLDAAGVTSYSVYPLYSPYRLVIDCVRPSLRSEAATASFGAASPAVVTASRKDPPQAPSLKARALTAEWIRRAPSMTP